MVSNRITFLSIILAFDNDLTHDPTLFFILAGDYDASSVKRAEDFVSNCRRWLESNSKLFWVAFQSNLLSDLSKVEPGFNKSFEQAKENFSMEGWALPMLRSNMRNQVNIGNIKIEKGSSLLDMQTSINKLPAASSVVGEVPLLVNVSPSNWPTKKEQILEHTIALMCKKNDKNIVILYDSDYYFKDIEKSVRNVVTNKTVLEYPSKKGGKKQSVQNVHQFAQQKNHILVTNRKYFNGCEASNVLYLSYGDYGIRNCSMRAVQNLITINVDGRAEIKGMKVDNTFN